MFKKRRKGRERERVCDHYLVVSCLDYRMLQKVYSRLVYEPATPRACQWSKEVVTVNVTGKHIENEERGGGDRNKRSK